ncbi:MAG: PqqD family protein [Planctomycetes bacterium]|nr:PqqD family protein [Planctomycetota bacterium]
MSNPTRLSHLTINPDGFLFDPTSGDSFVANPVAVAVLESLRDGGDEADAVAALTTRFEVSETEATRDVADLMVRLRSLHLL